MTMHASLDTLTTGPAPRRAVAVARTASRLETITLLEHSGSIPPCLLRQDARRPTDDPGGAGPPPNRCPVADR